jgi:hypothetical protein
MLNQFAQFHDIWYKHHTTSSHPTFLNNIPAINNTNMDAETLEMGNNTSLT